MKELIRKIAPDNHSSSLPHCVLLSNHEKFSNLSANTQAFHRRMCLACNKLYIQLASMKASLHIPVKI